MQIERRQLLTTAALTAASYQRILGANERIGIGLIGCGNRGINALLKGAIQFKEDQNIEFRAVCDIWKQHLEEAASVARNANAGDPKQLRAYRELLSMKELDAVIIATPDHQHATMLADAVRAGKDAYCEKPLGMEMKDLLTCMEGIPLQSQGSSLGCAPAHRLVRLSRFFARSAFQSHGALH